MSAIWFTGNYEDLSTDKGFQFKFRCEKCSNGYMSSFQISTLGVASSALQAAGNLFGGLLGRAASSAYEIQRAVGGPAHDAALKKASEEISAQFKQCSRCGQWVCAPVCWNHKSQMCEVCAPDLAEERTLAEDRAAREQIVQQARQGEASAGPALASGPASGAVLTCPACGATAQGGKFCADCGAALVVKMTCRHCGAQLQGGPRFCPECGEGQQMQA